MKRKLISLVFAFFLMSSIGFASPLTDYSAGKIALDFAWRPSGNVNLKVDNYGSESCPGGSSNHDLGITVGLGKRFAMQFRNSRGDTATMTDQDEYGTYAFKYGLQAQEVNLLYKINKSLSAFVGGVRISARASLNETILDGGSYYLSTRESITGYQLGMIGTHQIAKNLTAYGVIGFGDKIENYELGLGYAIAKNVELNLGYRSSKYKKLRFRDEEEGGYFDTFSYRFDGMSYGVTVKF